VRPARNIADSNPYEPPKEVLDYLRRKGLKPIWDWRDAWRQEHQVAFTVAGVMELDILEDIRSEVTRALQKGLPFQQFKKVIEPILADKGWLARKTVADPITGEKKDVELGKPGRLQTIFETNINSARAAGQWGRIQSVKDALPYLRYVHGPSRVPRPDHLALDGIILPADHTFWRTHYPPNGFGCLCSVRQISAREARSLGGVSPDPDVSPVRWENSRTGQVEYVPRGVDPGFDYNVGIDRMGGF